MRIYSTICTVIQIIFNNPGLMSTAVVDADQKPVGPSL